MIKRLIKVLLFVPVMLTTFPAECVIYGIRWIITGRSFPDEPIISKFSKW